MPAYMRNGFSPRSWSVSTCSANLGDAVPGNFWVGKAQCHRVCTQFLLRVSNVYDFQCTQGEKQTCGECVFGGIVEASRERGIAKAEPLAASAPGLCQVLLAPRGAEPAISCSSDGFCHLSGEGRNEASAPWGGRAALGNTACSWVSWKWW